jgi:hypothetical protein
MKFASRRQPSQRPVYFTSQTNTHVPMIRILTALVASVFAFLSASCCCTSEVKPPGLRPLPQFQEIQTAPEVHYSK